VKWAWKKEVSLQLRYLERIALRTPYPEVVERVVQVTRWPELAGRCRLAVDGTGVGRAVVTVPIAEELAFRGFLLRRLISPDFDLVDFRRFTYTAVVISSVVFGVLHGGRWIAGTVAGVLYAAAMLRRGRIGEAVVAHATTNALIAAWVLVRGDWYLW
jgi:CAAX prenyl protease-like protein